MWIKRLKRWTENLLTVAAFSTAIIICLITFATLLYSAHASFYVKDNMDQIVDDWIRYKAALDYRLDRLDGHSEFIRAKIKTIEKLDTGHKAGGKDGARIRLPK